MITMNCERLCVYYISNGDCNEQCPASPDPPTATTDLQKTTDADCDESKRDGIALTEIKVCFHFTSFACLLIRVIIIYCYAEAASNTKHKIHKTRNVVTTGENKGST